MDARCLAIPSNTPAPTTKEMLHQEHLKAVRTFEDEDGRPMLPCELDRFSREFYASYYREDLRRLVALGVADEEDP